MIGAQPKTQVETDAAWNAATPRFKLKLVPTDARTAECGNRRQCVLAHGTDRQLGLGGVGHVTASAGELSYSFKGFRYIYMMTQKARDYLTRFDQLGEAHGLEHARDVLVEELMLRPKTFTFPLAVVRPVPVISRARQDQVNERRRETVAEKRARGETIPRSSKRYVGV